MKTLNREEADIEFNKFWNELGEEWFKVEVLQDYSGEDMDESLEIWIDGDREKSIELFRNSIKDIQNSEWVKQATSTSAKKIRVRIVEQPYSPYLEWELEIYKIFNIPLAGEVIYFVDRMDVKDLSIPDGDFMIFDNKCVVRNYYTPEGRMYKADFYYEKDDINNF